MAAVITGTPTALNWGTSATPASQNVTVPADATAVYFFWSYFKSSGGDGAGLASVTMDGTVADAYYEFPVSSTNSTTGTGVAAWYNRGTGTKAIQPVWDVAPEEGPSSCVAFVKDGNLTAWTAALGDAKTGTNVPTCSLTTVAGDLVLKFNQSYSSVPGVTASWTDVLSVAANNGEAGRMTSISASGTSLTCDGAATYNYSTVVAVSIPAGGGGGPTYTLMGQAVM